MASSIVGRKEEQRILQMCCESAESEFIVVYGRRRIGKTYLIKEFFAGRFTFYATGLWDGTLREQLENFNAELSANGGGDLAPATSWRDAFQNLMVLVERSQVKGKKVIFLDEISWMDAWGSGFLKALDHFWNHFASGRRDVLLIVCGSATSWIVNNLVNNYGGLHNRLTKQIALQPFSLGECESYCESHAMSMPRHQLVEAYMVFGGVPYYYRLMDPRLGLYQNIDRLYFEQNAPLRNEYTNLVRSLFRKAENHLSVLDALARKGAGMGRAELLALAGLSNGGGATRVIDELVSCGFVREYLAFGGKERNRTYQLVDPFSLFHLRFHKKRMTYNENFWTQHSLTSAYHAWSGFAFEKICLLHLPQIRRALGIGGVMTEVSSWRSTGQGGVEREPDVRGSHGNGANRGDADQNYANQAGAATVPEVRREAQPGVQIDMVIDRSDGIINLCEMKFAANEYTITKSYSAALRNKRSSFLAETKTRKSAQTTLITTLGLRPNEYAQEIRFVLTLDDLFS